MVWLERIAREPLVHFLLIGAAIYALDGALGPEPEVASERTITVTAGDIEWMSRTWEQRWNRPPTEDELAGLVRAHVRETVLYREALAMGLDRDDVIVRRRLAQKLTFLTRDLARPPEPDEATLRAWFAERAPRYREPDRITFTQIFLDRDKRGERTISDAEAMKTALASLVPSAEEAAALGDSAMLETHFRGAAERDISRFFGSRFAGAVMALSPGAWHGPLPSGYGVHLVYVHERERASPPRYEALRDRVREDWMTEARESLDEQFLEELLARYRVIVETDAGP